ncbi:hypothetical protein AHAS_Ahas09G0244200 [Arachis hypogaea]
MDKHNHEFAPAVFARLLPSHRKMSDGDKAQVDSFKQFGIPTSKIMAYMAGQSGGYGMLRFTKRDLYNYVHGQRVARICDSDVAVTVSYLEGKANADMRTVARYTRTSDNRLGSLIWADGEMMMDYRLFGNMLAFESTYRSNKYRKPLVIFSGTNHHKQTSIFGFALLEDEEVRTYRWVLMNLLDVMGQKMPCVVVTDGDKVMRIAIAEVMPMVTHRLCGWHLEKNCVQWVKEAEFRKVFRKAIYANFEICEFEEYWMASVESLGLHDNTWVKSTILELVHSLDRVVKDYRNNEVTAQFYSTYYSPVLTTGLDSIERFASKVYTRAVFREVKKQIKAVATLLFRGKDSISTTTVYTFSWMGKPNRKHKDAKDCRSTQVDNKDGPEGRLLRYGAFFGAMSLVAQLGAEDAAEFVVARYGIANLIETLQRRHVDKGEGAPKRRRCTKCGVAGHTKRTCTWDRGECDAGTSATGGPSYMDHGSHDPAAPSATPQPIIVTQTSLVDNSIVIVLSTLSVSQGMQLQSGDPGDTLPAHGAGMTPSITHGGNSPFWLNPVGVEGGGTNFFLGRKHIEQFYTTQGCSGHTPQPSAHAASPSLGNPNAWKNEDLFERWLTQNVIGRMASKGKHGSVPKE